MQRHIEFDNFSDIRIRCQRPRQPLIDILRLIEFFPHFCGGVKRVIINYYFLTFRNRLELFNY